jgi:LysR family transcriptional regulator, glycine cleavage system transcriptional activator
MTRAAGERCVTQGAVSHQVKALELELGGQAIQSGTATAGHHTGGPRLPRRDPGCVRSYGARDRTVAAATGRGRPYGEHLAGFAAKWLVNRLGRFAEAHPGIDLRFAAQMHHADFISRVYVHNAQTARGCLDRGS